jgi:hypothetical protein
MNKFVWTKRASAGVYHTDYALNFEYTSRTEQPALSTFVFCCDPCKRVSAQHQVDYCYSKAVCPFVRQSVRLSVCDVVTYCAIFYKNLKAT